MFGKPAQTAAVPDRLEGEPVIGHWECVTRLSQDYMALLVMAGLFGGFSILAMSAAAYVDSGGGGLAAFGAYIRFAALVVIGGSFFLAAANRKGKKERIALTARGLFVDRAGRGTWTRSVDLERLKAVHLTLDGPTGGSRFEVSTSSSYDTLGPISEADADELIRLIVERSASPDSATITDERKQPRA